MSAKPSDSNYTKFFKEKKRLLLKANRISKLEKEKLNLFRDIAELSKYQIENKSTLAKACGYTPQEANYYFKKLKGGDKS
jgi:hypothetical protein